MKKGDRVKLLHPEPGEEEMEFIVTSINNKTKQVYIQPTTWRSIPPQELVGLDQIEKI